MPNGKPELPAIRRTAAKTSLPKDWRKKIAIQLTTKYLAKALLRSILEEGETEEMGLD